MIQIFDFIGQLINGHEAIFQYGFWGVVVFIVMFGLHMFKKKIIVLLKNNGFKTGVWLCNLSYMINSKFVKNKKNIVEILELQTIWGNAIDKGWDFRMKELKNTLR